MTTQTQERKIEQVTYSISEVAKMLGCSRGLVYAKVRDGEIKAIKLGRKIMIHRTVVESILGA
jgi:excisionase family DNA binding protein